MEFVASAAAVRRRRRIMSVGAHSRIVIIVILLLLLVTVLRSSHAFCPTAGPSYKRQRAASASRSRVRLEATSSKQLKEDRNKRDGGSSSSRPSSKRKQKRKRKSDKSSSAVERLKRAAATAATLYPAPPETTEGSTTLPYGQQAQGQSSSSSPQLQASSSSSSIGTLQQLTHAIDEQLLSRQSSTQSFASPSSSSRRRSPPPLQPRDSMSALLEYNDEHGRQTYATAPIVNSNTTTTAPIPTTKTFQVALVFGKTLQDDQVTVEYASRIQTLVRQLQLHDSSTTTSGDGAPPPFDVICFCGSTLTNGSDGGSVCDNSDDNNVKNHVATADAGYIYFRHLCAAQHINLSQHSNIQIYIDRSTHCKDDGTVMAHVAKHLQTTYIPKWLRDVAPAADATAAVSPDETTTTSSSSSLSPRPSRRGGSGGGIKSKPRRIHIHFTLLSTGHHLCNLNDIHHRSPGQSFLRPLGLLRRRKEYVWENNHDDNQDDDDDYETSSTQWTATTTTTNREGGMVETSWSYRYAPYPYLYAKQDSVAFMAKCYLLGQELIPLYVNLKGVVQEKEFFQRDNYLVLASIRRLLVSQMEDLYKTRPRLRTDLRSTSARRCQDVNVVMEGVVLSLGRCIDLVKPAGLLVGSVSKNDYIKALRSLEHAICQIRLHCDPDVPLDPEEWGKLRLNEKSDDEHVQHERLYAQLDSILQLDDENATKIELEVPDDGDDAEEERNEEVGEAAPPTVLLDEDEDDN